MQQAKPAHEQLTQYRDQLAADLHRVEQSVSLLIEVTHALCYVSALRSAAVLLQAN
jgi:hypothetical protein